MDKILIFDTTLRDGEQSPGFSMNVEEKLRMARQLEDLGVDILEAGFPITSAGDLEGVRAVSRQSKACAVAALARVRQEDIDAALKALEPARKPRIHVFLATSDLHLKHKLRMTREEARDKIGAMVSYARSRCPDVEFSAEDASRSDPDYLCEVIEVAAQAGATTLNLPDTVGYNLPEEYSVMFRRVHERLKNHPDAVLSAHCHDDLGLAVANSLAAIGGGARQVECTINGIGERAGNAALEEIAVALHVRQAHYGVASGIHLEKIYETSRLLASIAGIGVAPNKAVVGDNAFAHEAGIHQDGILKNPLTYEIILPEQVGQPARRLVVGKHSGRNALRAHLADLGCPVTDEELLVCYRQVMLLADKTKHVSDEDLVAIWKKVRSVGPAASNSVPITAG